ncbi:hypothetical protein Vafri_10913, partial [Volvox africanus]
TIIIVIIADCMLLAWRPAFTTTKQMYGQRNVPPALDDTTRLQDGAGVVKSRGKGTCPQAGAQVHRWQVGAHLTLFISAIAAVAQAQLTLRIAAARVSRCGTILWQWL